MITKKEILELSMLGLSKAEIEKVFGVSKNLWKENSELSSTYKEGHKRSLKKVNIKLITNILKTEKL